VQEHIQKSLEAYNTEIRELQETMEHATQSARQIRADINELNRR
jgi:prefoldin subunit 5